MLPLLAIWVISIEGYNAAVNPDTQGLVVFFCPEAGSQKPNPEELAEQLKALIAPVEDTGSIPSTHIAVPICNYQARDPEPSSDLCRYQAHRQLHTDICRQIHPYA